ncbi:predicted protein [Histoplasma capsulatum H143]|uniref:Uncharacterized protein n=1 Tax=Ajellomyces capsulatus (strain H143) TaxID=544712 RepID=C6HGI8_AJECH|nr:predicted protein [Histoplasma capsulatum H143]
MSRHMWYILERLRSTGLSPVWPLFVDEMGIGKDETQPTRARKGPDRPASKGGQTALCLPPHGVRWDKPGHVWIGHGMGHPRPPCSRVWSTASPSQSLSDSIDSIRRPSSPNIISTEYLAAFLTAFLKRPPDVFPPES